MKITKVDVFMLDAGSQRWQRKPIVCRIYTDEGIYGDGEAGIAFGIGSTAAFGMVKDLAGLIVGMDPMNIEVIWNKMFKSSFWGMAEVPSYLLVSARLILHCGTLRARH